VFPTDEIAGHLEKKFRSFGPCQTPPSPIGKIDDLPLCKRCQWKHLEEVQTIFNALGKTLVIEEGNEGCDCSSASGIAFAMRSCELLLREEFKWALNSEEAQLIASQTALGACFAPLSRESHPEMEIDKVTTPEGCTIAG